MIKIVATFSNGFTDTYKGKRAVSAAWMITRRDTGEVLNSGHSLDRMTAQKTAEGNVRYCRLSTEEKPLHTLFTGKSRGFATPASIKYAAERARAAGWDGKGNCDRWIRAYNDRINAERRAMVNIEVVDL